MYAYGRLFLPSFAAPLSCLPRARLRECPFILLEVPCTELRRRMEYPNLLTE